MSPGHNSALKFVHFRTEKDESIEASKLESSCLLPALNQRNIDKKYEAMNPLLCTSLPTTSFEKNFNIKSHETTIVQKSIFSSKKVSHLT